MTQSLALRLFAGVLAVLAFLPVIAGGLVTNTGSATTGILTLVLAVWLEVSSPSPLFRRLAWIAVALALLQAVMSELMVLWGLPMVSAIAHDALEQIYFAWMVGLAVMLQWPATESKTFPCGDKKLLRLTALTTGFVVWQLVAGAIYRYTGRGLHMHFLGAVLVLIHALLVTRRIFTPYRDEPWLFYSALGLLGLVVSQGVLGMLTWRTPTVAIMITHISVGALILAVSLSLTLLAARRLPPSALEPRV